MNSRALYLLVFGLLAASAAVVFLAISIDSDIYAPGALALGSHVHVRSAIGKSFPQVYSHDLSPERVLRKIYSIGAFAVVAFFAAPLFPRTVRLRAGASLVAGFSLAIEFAQRAHVSHESNFSSLFDVACGAVGGVIGALAYNAVSARVRRGRQDAS